MAFKTTTQPEVIVIDDDNEEDRRDIYRGVMIEEKTGRGRGGGPRMAPTLKGKEKDESSDEEDDEDHEFAFLFTEKPPTTTTDDSLPFGGILPLPSASPSPPHLFGPPIEPLVPSRTLLQEEEERGDEEGEDIKEWLKSKVIAPILELFEDIDFEFLYSRFEEVLTSVLKPLSNSSSSSLSEAQRGTLLQNILEIISNGLLEGDYPRNRMMTTTTTTTTTKTTTLTTNNVAGAKRGRDELELDRIDGEVDGGKRVRMEGGREKEMEKERELEDEVAADEEEEAMIAKETEGRKVDYYSDTTPTTVAYRNAT
jgi:hypothetical protein